MAEIKSTLDLVMERTRHLTLSREDKAAIEREEQLKKAPGYVHKFLEGAWKLSEMEAELERLTDETLREEFSRELMDRFLAETDLGENGARCLEALSLLAGKRHRVWLERLRQVISEYRETREQWLESREGQMRAELSALGISGDAVVVDPGKSPAWQTRRSEFEARLEKAKAAWLEGR